MNENKCEYEHSIHGYEYDDWTIGVDRYGRILVQFQNGNLSLGGASVEDLKKLSIVFRKAAQDQERQGPQA